MSIILDFANCKEIPQGAYHMMQIMLKHSELLQLSMFAH